MARVQQLSAEIGRQLSGVESSRSRALTLDASYKALGMLSVKQDDLFRQALRCIEAELYRAAHVMAWAAAIDFLHARLGTDLAGCRTARPKWKVANVEDLREQADYQVIELAYEVGALRKNEMKAFLGHLNTRNECAHPDDVYPGLNQALGYIDDLFKRLQRLKERPWP